MFKDLAGLVISSDISQQSTWDRVLICLLCPHNESLTPVSVFYYCYCHYYTWLLIIILSNLQTIRSGFCKCPERSKVASGGFISFLSPKKHGKEIYYLLQLEETVKAVNCTHNIGLKNSLFFIYQNQTLFFCLDNEKFHPIVKISFSKDNIITQGNVKWTHAKDLYNSLITEIVRC